MTWEPKNKLDDEDVDVSDDDDKDDDKGNSFLNYQFVYLINLVCVKKCITI